MTPKALRVHVGLTDAKMSSLLKDDEPDGSSDVLAQFATKLGLTDANLKQAKFGIITGTVAPTQLEALKSAKGVKWVEEDQKRHAMPSTSPETTAKPPAPKKAARRKK